jgi:mono/diheme cytochrome c family protein
MFRQYYLAAAAAVVFSLGAHAAAPTNQQSQIAHGAYLARAGDCVACHSAPGGKAYAGGLYLSSRFGQIASPNITPDKATGIGQWTDEQFYNSFHKGLDNDGAYLYPAMPYQWFTRVTRDDALAIKAYLFSLQPVNAPQKPNHLTFPFNIRAGIGGWNALYFKAGTYQPDTSKSTQWNRGAYLVEGLGHCAACHTPRNAVQGSIESQAYAGGVVDNWAAPNITSDKKEGIGGWSAGTITAYLKKGSAQGKGAAFGPMAQTVHDSLAHLTDDDLTDIAIYLKTIPAKATYRENTKQSAYVHQAGAQVYLENCSSCHQPNGSGLGPTVPALAGNGAVTAKAPDDVIRAVVGGMPAQNTYAPMPGFATVLTPQEIADVSNYVRTSWGNGAPATASPDLVNTILPKSQTMMAGTHWCTKQGDTKLDQAIKDPSGGVQPALQQINETTLLPQVQKIVADLHKSVPDAQHADIVNALTAAYCPMVFSNRAIPAAERGPTLDRFASLVFTELVQPGTGKRASH